MTNEQLASECRRWKVAALVLTFALGLVLAVSARADLPYPEQSGSPASPGLACWGDRIRARTVEVDEFVLKDAAGNVRARMATDGKGAQLTIYDEQGKVVATVPPKPHMMEVR